MIHYRNSDSFNWATQSKENAALQNLPLIRRGSVKNLRGPLPSGEIIFEFSDDFSVFDWGKMPDLIPEKGCSLMGLAAHLFEALGNPETWRTFFSSREARPLEFLSAEYLPLFVALRAQLEECGMRSAFRGLYPETNPAGLKMERMAIVPPKGIEHTDGKTIFDYSNAPRDAHGTLIPLEVVFRHALMDRSSFFERNPDTALKPGHRFELPLIEFFTKLEPTDRFVATRSEASSVGRVSPKTVIELTLRTILLSLWLKRECRLRSLDLIDGKFEWGLDQEGRVTLCDAIGPDELRLVELAGEDSKPLSKEFLRTAYRNSAWYAEIQALKAQNRQGPGWQKLVQAPVPLLPRDQIARATALYRGLEARFRPENVLLLGSGGREHAIARKLLESPNLMKLVWAPGQDAAVSQLQSHLDANPAPFESSRVKKLIQKKDFSWSVEKKEALLNLAREEGITLVIVSQDSDLASGAADAFREAGIDVFGPGREAARIEWSKAFMKEICESAHVPTARSHLAESTKEAEALVRELPWSASSTWVIKADGLALGKGVILPENRQEALKAIDQLAKFGSRFVIEERLTGEESSWFAVTDGDAIRVLDSAKDYKRLGENQTGPNTGGMGALSPAPKVSEEFKARVLREIFEPTVKELNRRGIRYQGVLYAGLISDGFEAHSKLSLLEFNARFGDPETQALLPRFEEDFLVWLGAVARTSLSDFAHSPRFSKKSAVYVVAACDGYPASPKTGVAIELQPATITDDLFRFSGLKRTSDGWEISGGRVLGALGLGDTADLARESAFLKLESALFQGAAVRKDIGR